MSATHPTITDKDREVGMAEDGLWHPWQVKRFDGLIEPDFAPPMLPGDELLDFRTYFVNVSVSGLIVTEPDSRIDVRLDRYPFDPDDNGTAWNYISLTKRVVSGSWHGTFGGKIEIWREGSYSTSMGLGYRVSGGAIKIDSRVVKFLRLRDA